MPLPALLIFAAGLDVDVGVVLSCSSFFHLFFFLSFILSFLARLSFSACHGFLRISPHSPWTSALINASADFVMSGIKVLLQEYALDGDPKRFALLATLPVIFCVSIVRVFALV
jgi:hypothetical protein